MYSYNELRRIFGVPYKKVFSGREKYPRGLLMSIRYSCFNFSKVKYDMLYRRNVCNNVN